MKTHLAYRTPEVAREREGTTNLEIESGILLKFQSKENVAKRISLKAWLPFRLRGRPFFSFTVPSLWGIILRVSTTRRLQ
jgi:hypothetical protein